MAGTFYISPGTNLNTQYTGAMAYPTPVACYYSYSGGSVEVSPGREPGPHGSTGYLEWLDYVLGQSSIQTVSLGTICKRRISLRNMRRLCVTCSRYSVRLEPASSPRAAILASALGTLENVSFFTHLPCILSVWRLISPCELYTGTGTRRSLDRRTFAGLWVLVSTGRRTKWRISLVAVSRPTFSAPTTSTSRWQPSSRTSALIMPTSTSAFAPVTQPNPPIHYVTRTFLRAAASPILPCNNR